MHYGNDGVFYCKVDAYTATKDYLRAGRCVRYIGVTPRDFAPGRLQEGVTTYTIDVDYWQFCEKVFGLSSWRAVHRHHCDHVDRSEIAGHGDQRWYRVEIEPSHRKTSNYFYQTFSEEPPNHFHLKHIHEVSGPELPDVLYVTRHRIPREREGEFVFDAFHVGQGMCSLVHSGRTGILLDAGAGKPVTRKAYLGGRIQNDLSSMLARMSRFDLVLSHPDSDHWRMLAWDTGLRNRVERIYVPKGARALALQDVAVRHKIAGISNSHVSLSRGTRLLLLRSQPATSDSNGECLVAVFWKGRQRVLAAGDYVYTRLRTDGNPLLRIASFGTYHGVVVPHHGDQASANAVVRAAPGAKAFFSAGTHQKYRHPRPASLRAHRQRHFSVISNNRERNIRRVNLI